MSDGCAQSLPFHRYAKPAFTPALLVSLAVHAAAAGLLLQGWQIAAVEPPHPLTVTLAAAPPMVAERPPDLPVEHTHEIPFTPRSRALPVKPLHHAPLPSLIAVERTEIAPAATVAAPVAEAPPAPVLLAKAPATVSAPGRADTIEPPHFNVAYLSNPRPAYPPMARKLGIEGVVLLRVNVTAQGAPEKIVIAQSSGASVLDDAALKAVQGWTFVPARRGDTPIAHPVDVPIRFHLSNSNSN